MNGLRSSVALRLLVLWGAFILYGTTIPFDLHPGLWTLAKGWEKAHKVPWITPDGGPSLPDVVTNLLLFVPWGFLVAVHLARRARPLASTLLWCGASALVMSGGVEFLQLLSSERQTSATDLVNNGIGAVIGGAVGWLAATRVRVAVEPRLRELLRREPLTALALAVALLTLFWSVSPFDPSLDVDDLKASIKSARPLPFGDPIRGAPPPPRPGRDAATILSWSLIGGVFGLAARGKGRHGVRLAATGLGAVLALAILSEAVQLLVRSRGTDATTVFWAGAGGALGIAAVAAGGGWSPRLVVVALAGWGAATLAAGLEPWKFDFAARGPFDWTPFIHHFANTNAYALADASMQILLYLPLGGLLAAHDRRLSVVRAGLAGAAVAAFVEGCQLFLPARFSDSTDILLAAGGAAAGLWVWRRASSLRAEG